MAYFGTGTTPSGEPRMTRTDQAFGLNAGYDKAQAPSVTVLAEPALLYLRITL